MGSIVFTIVPKVLLSKGFDRLVALIHFVVVEQPARVRCRKRRESRRASRRPRRRYRRRKDRPAPSPRPRPCPLHASHRVCGLSRITQGRHVRAGRARPSWRVRVSSTRFIAAGALARCCCFCICTLCSLGRVRACRLASKGLFALGRDVLHDEIGGDQAKHQMHHHRQRQEVKSQPSPVVPCAAALRRRRYRNRFGRGNDSVHCGRREKFPHILPGIYREYTMDFYLQPGIARPADVRLNRRYTSSCKLIPVTLQPRFMVCFQFDPQAAPRRSVFFPTK